MKTEPENPGTLKGLRLLFPDYLFLARIGSGAYGEIWLATAPEGQHRAIKFIAKGGPGDDSRYGREHRGIQLLKTLRDIPPGIVPILDVREDPQAGFGYVMELADAERPLWQEHPEEYRPKTLRGELVARRALPLAESIDIGIRLADALEFLQRHRLVHRDIKPSNVIYIQGKPVLADVGLLVDTREAESLVGTPGYVPREQHGHFSGDIYSLGVLLTEISTGRPADENGFSPVEESDTDAPGYARWMDILRRACESNPENRYQTAAALLRDLQELRQNPLGPPKPRSKWLWIATGIVLLLASLAGLAVYLWPKPHPTADTATPIPANVATPGPRGEEARHAVQKEVDRVMETIQENLSKPAFIPSEDPVKPVPPGPHPGTAMNFSAPAGTIQNGAFLEVYPDRIFIGKGKSASMEDWRVVFVWQPDDFRAPSLLIRPIEPIQDQGAPQESILIRLPADSSDPKASPDGVVQIPPESVHGDLQHPYRFPVWIFLTTDKPGQWEDAVRTLNEEQLRRVDEFMARAQKENMSETEIRVELETTAPFYGLQELWSRTYRNRHEDK